MLIEECDFCTKIGDGCQSRSQAEKCLFFDKAHADKVLEYKIWFYKNIKCMDYKDE